MKRKRFLSYQKAKVVHDMTVYFCKELMPEGCSTAESMLNAAKECRYNIYKGSIYKAPIKSKIEHLNVATERLAELFGYYKEYLSSNGLEMWEKESEETLFIRLLGREHNDAEFFLEMALTHPPQTVANTVIVLIKQADYLLFRQLQILVANGGPSNIPSKESPSMGSPSMGNIPMGSMPQALP